MSNKSKQLTGYQYDDVISKYRELKTLVNTLIEKMDEKK